MIRRLSLTAALVFAATAPALAHLNPNEHGSFLAGLSHPLFGWDHILVMVAVGIWAAMIGGKALWAVPLAFVSTMSVGFIAALYAIPLPFVEPAILASVVAVGLLVAAAVRLPVAIAALVVGCFALFHGHAHGAELGNAGALNFGVGFALATAALHGVGLVAGYGLSRLGHPLLLRAIGAGSAVAGVYLMVA